jgi:hypothetical protein
MAATVTMFPAAAKPIVFAPPLRLGANVNENGKIIGPMGTLGENGGQFFGLHMIAVDSKGIIYTGEVSQGERVQRFLPVK